MMRLVCASRSTTMAVHIRDLSRGPYVQDSGKERHSDDRWLCGARLPEPDRGAGPLPGDVDEYRLAREET